jgi:hypothetical protein
MKYTLLTLSILAIPLPAIAGPCGTKPCTTEQINRALQWLGRPEYEQIGHGRVLFDNEAPAAGTTVTKSTVNVRFK